MINKSVEQPRYLLRGMIWKDLQGVWVTARKTKNQKHIIIVKEKEPAHGHNVHTHTHEIYLSIE